MRGVQPYGHGCLIHHLLAFAIDREGARWSFVGYSSPSHRTVQRPSGPRLFPLDFEGCVTKGAVPLAFHRCLCDVAVLGHEQQSHR